MNVMIEIPFRVIFGFLWLLHFGVRLYFQSKVKGVSYYVRVNESQEKLFFRLFAVAYLFLPLYWVTSWIDFAHMQLPEWLRWVGVGVTCLGIWFVWLGAPGVRAQLDGGVSIIICT